MSTEHFLTESELNAELSARKRDVDRTLLRENLKLTPIERIRKHQRIVEFVEKLRNAGRALRDKS